MSESLGGKIGTYGIDRRFLFQQFLFWGIVAFLPTFGIILRTPSPALPVGALFIWFALYLITILAWDMLTPQLVLYENGIMVIETSRRSTYYWHELSHMDGTRHSYSVKGIPVARWGANQFYTLDGAAFKVGAWRADANALVDFILMKMTEQRIGSEIAKVEGGSLMSYGNTHVAVKGIEKNGQHYAWSAIRGLSFRYWEDTQITLELKNGKSLRLDNMEGLAFYSFVGVFDYYMKSKYTHEIQQDRIQFRRRMKHGFGTAARVMAIVVGLTILSIAGITGIFVISELAK
jgi:hypothetical protein